MPQKNEMAWWKGLGVGFITGAAGDDPSGIATYSRWVRRPSRSAKPSDGGPASSGSRDARSCSMARSRSPHSAAC